MNHVVLITGGSGGIGLALAKRFAEAGDKLVLVARNEEKLAAAIDELADAVVHSIAIDLSEPAAPKKVFAELNERRIAIDVLVNNAGFGASGKFQDMDLARQLSMIQTNVTALTALTHLFLPAMLQRGRGKILNVASTAAFQPGPLMAVYYATKAYVLSFSEAVAEELRGTGVSVSTLCPGPTRTGFAEEAGMTQSRLFRDANTMNVDEVANHAYRGLLKGKRLIIPGFGNKALLFMNRIAPRFLVARVVKRLQEK